MTLLLFKCLFISLNSTLNQKREKTRGKCQQVAVLKQQRTKRGRGPTLFTETRAILPVAIKATIKTVQNIVNALFLTLTRCNYKLFIKNRKQNARLDNNTERSGTFLQPGSFSSILSLYRLGAMGVPERPTAGEPAQTCYHRRGGSNVVGGVLLLFLNFIQI